MNDSTQDKDNHQVAFDAPLSAFPPGEVIGNRYEVVKSLGRGGMGMVYLVHDQKQNRKVALKTLLPEHSGRKRALARFEREVSLVRKLNHPCIVKVYDAWRIGDLFVYTMEYIEGESLRRVIRKKGRFGLGSTIRILSMLAHALHHAHQHTIHRDLSPDNVMIDKTGSVKLLDFGLAKQVDNVGTFTMVGANLGKMQYNAPEQQLNAREVDRRADIYSMGIMFYELLTGIMPEPGRMKPILDLRPDLPVECQAFLDKATAAKADDRFQDAREFRKALQELYKTTKRFETPAPVGDDITAIIDTSRFSSAPPAGEEPSAFGDANTGGDDEIVIDVRRRNPIVEFFQKLFGRSKE